jgi:hypothetical protein
MSKFQHPSETKGVVSIGTVDHAPDFPAIEVKAQYNPKELSVEFAVPWNVNPQSNKAPQKGIQLEFTGAQGRSMSLELTFDGYETNTSVADSIRDLHKMASVKKAGDADENKRRPYMCVVTWGDTVQNFRCVIESLSTKYTMFSETGVPLRATCIVKLKEADVLSMAKTDGM